MLFGFEEFEGKKMQKEELQVYGSAEEIGEGKMTYETRNKRLKIGVYEEIKLTDREDKLLMCLSNNDVARYEDIMKKLGISMNELRRLKKRLVEDTVLNIKTINGVGYRLEDEIYFE